MRKVLIAAAALGVLASAVPATAQSFGYDRYDQRDNGHDRGLGYGQQPSQRVWRVQQTIDRLLQQGRLDRREASYFRREAYQLGRLDQRYRYDGYSRSERRDLDRRSDDLLRAVRRASDDRYGDGRRDRDDDWRDRR